MASSHCSGGEVGVRIDFQGQGELPKEVMAGGDEFEGNGVGLVHGSFQAVEGTKTHRHPVGHSSSA